MRAVRARASADSAREDGARAGHGSLGTHATLDVGAQHAPPLAAVVDALALLDDLVGRHNLAVARAPSKPSSSRARATTIESTTTSEIATPSDASRSASVAPSAARSVCTKHTSTSPPVLITFFSGDAIVVANALENAAFLEAHAVESMVTQFYFWSS